MNNADMPAMPLVESDGAASRAEEAWVWSDRRACIGLTKREHFAGLAMQALISAGAFRHSHSSEGIAKEAAGYADALLAELERTS